MLTKTQVMNGTKADRAALDKIFAAETRKQEAQQAQTTKALEALRGKYKAERSRVIGPSLQAKLDSYAAEHKVPGLKPGEDSPTRLEATRQQRLASFRFAHELGLNWAGLAELNAKTEQELRHIITPRRTVPAFGDVQITEPRPTEPQPLPLPGKHPTALAAPSLSSAAAYGPPYPGWWDRSFGGMATREGRIVRNDSYLYADWAQTGALIGGRNYDAAGFAFNYDMLHAHRENGYLVPYTPNSNGFLEVQFDLQCAVCQHSIWLYNEWGWSSCTARTNEDAVMSVFWNWEDVTPASETYDVNFISGLDVSGNGDHYPGVVLPAPQGQLRTVTLYTTSSFPAGVPLWLYVGSQQRILASLDDVSLDMWVNSAWYVTGIRVRSV